MAGGAGGGGGLTGGLLELLLPHPVRPNAMPAIKRSMGEELRLSCSMVGSGCIGERTIVRSPVAPLNTYIRLLEDPNVKWIHKISIDLIKIFLII